VFSAPYRIPLASPRSDVHGTGMYRRHRNDPSETSGRQISTSIGAIWHGSRRYRLGATAFLLFLILSVLGGGASRTDVLSLIYLRPAAVLCIGVLAWSGSLKDRRGDMLPLAGLLLLAGCIAIQLIPLPPTIWAAMPGHGRYTEAATLLGVSQPWRPISIAPDLTLNSLLALIPVLAIALGMISIRREHRGALLPILIGVAVLSAAFGVLQVAQGQGYLYTNRSLDVADGIFANRNHHAVFLASAIVLLGAWPALSAHNGREVVQRGIAAGCAGLFLFMIIVATGSRSGLLLGAIAGMFASLTFARGLTSGGWGRRVASLGLPIAIAAAVLLMVVWGRAASLDRLVGVDLQGEQRLSSLPTLMRMIGEYLPWGSGFGTFDPAFRTAEPDALLHYAFFNHAHDDAIEIILTGGIPAAALAIVVLGWWGWTSYRVFAAAGRTPRLLLGRAGSVIMALLGAASLSDYPLRTPLLGGVFLIAAYWLHDALAADRTSEGSSAGQHVAFS
jgi:hypothetical protein